jgi:hypothetical protein
MGLHFVFVASALYCNCGSQTEDADDPIKWRTGKRHRTGNQDGSGAGPGGPEKLAVGFKSSLTDLYRRNGFISIDWSILSSVPLLWMFIPK